MKQCPFCRKAIQDDAIKCKHCGEFLKKKHKGLNCLLGCLITYFVFTLLGNIFLYLIFCFFREAIYRAPFIMPNLPHFYLPLNALDLQIMLRDLSEGFRVFWETVTGGSLRDYQRIYL